MKKLLSILFLSILFLGCSNPNSELFKETDKFVTSLDTDYKSYGTFGGLEHAVKTPDGLYQIMPIGRLINVKILRVAEPNEYEDLREDLEKHYKNDSRVNKVYISKGGTVMIDCRN